MSIRTRLALGIALVLALTLTALGAILVGTVQDSLIDQVDDRLMATARQGTPLLTAAELDWPPGPPPRPGEPPGSAGSDRPPGLPPRPGGPPGAPGADRPGGPPGPPGADRPLGPASRPPPLDAEGRNFPSPLYGPLSPPTREIDPTGRLVAQYLYAADGTLRLEAPSGFAEQPDPPPRLPPIPSPAADGLIGRIVTLPAVDHSVEYRVLVRPAPRGELLVTAGSLSTTQATLQQLVRVLVGAGAVILVAAVLTSWWLIRRGLRPVDEMVDTAAAIAAGDLTRRVPHVSRGSELNRLGVALNDMLHQIEQGVRERAENEARLRRFVADAAHELRTPLTALQGYAELYRQGALADAAALDQAMGRILGESARMARLVDDLLLLARLDHQRGLELERLDVVAVVREAATDFAVVAPDRPLSEALDGEAVVLGDRHRLRQVVDNLLANARIHTPAGTPVRLATRREGGQVTVTVADEGPGIPPADQPRVFERFWRADPSRVRRTGGSGLGLAIVASIVQAHGGTVTLDSAPGRGAAFTLRLPLAG